MFKFPSSGKFFVTQDLMGFLDDLVNQKIFSRRLDALIFGFSVALVSNLEPAVPQKRHELTDVFSLADDERHVCEAMTHCYLVDRSVEPKDEREHLDFFCRLGMSGLMEMRKRWKGRGVPQILQDILHWTPALSNE